MAERGLEPAMACVKYLILVFNCMLVITGMLLIGVGSTISGYFESYDKLLGSEYVSPSLFLIAIGVIIFFVALFGCIGAAKESVCWMNMYTVSLIVIFIFEVAAVIAGFAMHSSIEETLSTNMVKAIQEYETGSQYMRDTLDSIQSELTCCGANGPMDWANVMDEEGWLDHEDDIFLPDSCCGAFQMPEGNATEILCSQPHLDGCLPTLESYALSTATTFICVAIIIAICQAIGIGFSNSLARAIRKAKSIRTMRQMEIRNRVLDSYAPMNKSSDTTPTPVLYISADSTDTTA